ncbi:MAG TPA: 2'-5' RNA ligase family protein [Actinocrinis sp.]|nr:2'-5' RNA ligase family protein [Actinocrinis sp.]
MEPFPTADLAWEPGETRWHVYVLPEPDNQALAELIVATRTVSLKVAGDRLVPVGDFAHATVHMVSIPAHQLAPGSVEQLAGALRAAVADLVPFQVTVGDASAGTGSVCLNMDQDQPGQPWAVLTERIAQVIADQFGPRAQQYHPPKPHIAVLYCAEAADSGQIQSALRREISPSRALMRVDCVWLLDVRQSVPDHTYTWPDTTAVRIDLGQVSLSGS